MHSKNLDPRDDLDARRGPWGDRQWIFVDQSRETVGKLGDVLVETSWLSVFDAPGAPFRRDEEGHYVAVLPVEELSAASLGALLLKVGAAFCHEGEGCCDDPSPVEP